MLYIILLILKILGMILLVLISLLLLLLLTVLLVPIRYRLLATHGEHQFSMEGTISWLLHIIHARISMTDLKPHIRARIFGIVVFDNLKVKKTKTKYMKKSKSRKSRNIRNRRTNYTKETSAGEPHIETISKKDDIPKVETTEQVSKKDNIPKVETTERASKTEAPINSKKEEMPRINKIIEEPEIKEQRQSLFQKFRNQIKRFKEKIITFFQGIKGRIKKWIDTSANIKRKIELLLDFIRDEINQEAFKLTYSSLIKLLKHILPTKLKSSIIFGTGDPCSTGQALGAFSILYSIYGDKIQITPDFENKRFEGRHAARGRIRLVTILIIVIKLILDKRFKYLKGNMKTLKEAL